MKCTQCGTEFQGNFCPECGARAEKAENVAAQSESTQNTAQKQTTFTPPPKKMRVRPEKSKNHSIKEGGLLSFL